MRAFIRFCLATLGLVALAALFALPDGTLADAPFKVVHNGATTGDAFDTDVCGIPTHIELFGTETVHIDEGIFGDPDSGADALAYGHINQHLTVVFTSQANGHVLHVLTQDLFRTYDDISIVNNGGTIWTLTYSFSGLAIRLRDGNRTLVRDVGRVVFTDVIDLHDLSTTEDTELISGTIDFMAGPHPTLTSVAFCQAYVPVMT